MHGSRQHCQATDYWTAAWMNTEVPHGDELADLRVALLTNCLSPHTLPLCQAISRRVKDFRAFISAESDDFHNFPRMEGGFPVTLQRSLNALRFFRREHGFWTANQLHIPYDTFHQLRKYRPDVILSSQFGIRTLLSTLYRLRRPRVRLFLWATLSTHTEQNRAWYRRALRHWVIRHIDGACVNGKGGEEYLRSLGFKGPISTLPYTIDDALFCSSEYQPSGQILRLLYCGRLDPCKGVRAFCERLDTWCSSHTHAKVHFEVVGSGPEGDVIRCLKTSPNLTVSVLPRMDQSSLACRYHAADIFVLPTLGDEWAVVVNEAMSAGLPVLGSIYSQAVTELIEEGCSGWIFDPLDERSTFSALDRALTSTSAKLCTMSKSAAERIASLSPEKVAARAIQTMQAVARKESAEHNVRTLPLLRKALR